MNQPVGVQALRELLLALQLAAQREVTAPFQRLYADQALSEPALGYRDRVVGRFVVDQICADAVLGEMIEAVTDEALLVVGLQHRDDLHGAIISLT